MEKKNFFLVMAKFMGIILFIAALIGVIFFMLKEEYGSAFFCGFITYLSFPMKKNW